MQSRNGENMTLDKVWENLTISNDFMFAKVMRNKDICKKILEKKGELYSKLNKSFVIFICTFDPFGEGRHIYTFKYICEENKELYLNDEAIKIFLNSRGKLDDVDEDVKSFLNYVDGRSTDNKLVKEIDDEIKRVKRNREWKVEFMTLLMREREIEDRALKRGVKLGKIRGVKLGEKRGVKLGEKRGEERGIKLGEERGIKTLIKFCQEINLSLEDTYKQIMEKYELTSDTAKEMLKKYWQ